MSDVPVMPRDNDSTGTGLFPLFDIVNLIEALPGVSSLELLGQVIVTDASGVHHRFWRKDVLNQPRDQNPCGTRFGNEYVLQRREQRFGQLPQPRR